jgi:hypothetical protein
MSNLEGNFFPSRIKKKVFIGVLGEVSRKGGFSLRENINHKFVKRGESMMDEN